MKRPLETHFIRNVRNGLQDLTKAVFVFAFLILAFNQSYSQTFARSECNCLDNASNDEDGQYAERITVNSDAGETWTIASVDGLFRSDSPAPPAAPLEFPANFELTEFAPGVYILQAIRVSGTAWTVTLNDGTGSFTVTSAHTCTYPTEDVIGDLGTCVGTLETYEVDVQADQIESIIWTVSGGGIIVGGQNTRRIFVDWGDVVGDYEVAFEGTAFGFDGQSTGACPFEGSEDVAVMDEEAFSMACNNQINISLNGRCEIDFLADMVLEDMRFGNESYDLEFTDVNTGEIVVGPTIGMEYVGSKLQVKVIHECSGNSCWGFVLLEDKSIPQLDCGDDVVIDCDELMTPANTGFPVPDDVTITNLGDDKYLLQGFDLCSDVELIFEDVPVTTNLCDGPFSSIVNRNWKATDASGNMSTCVQTISINRASLVDITFPDNYDDVLGPNPSIQACSIYPVLPDGNPDPSFTGMPEGIFCLNVTVDYEDTRIEKCGDKAYKIRRRWMVNDLCDQLPAREHTQFITVMDSEAPDVAAPPEFSVGTTPTTCSSIIEVPAPIIIFECSDYDYTVSYKIPDANGDPFFQPSNDGVVRQSDGTYLISGLDDLTGNMVWILYYVTDACGNQSTAFTEVTIIDDIQPIPVCDLHTFVGLNENGIGYASIESFDDGSWDNCGEITREVRRVDNFGCGESSQYGDRVKFCCSDVGNVIMVQMRVTDAAGNSNICMVEAEVQDNHAPVITFCPADVTIDCDDDTVNLDQYGTAIATDNCNVTITSTASRNINSCGTGTITRTFRAEDANGNFVTCTQRVRVVSLDPFYVNPNNPNDNNDDIQWPGSHTVTNGCATNGILPDDLPAGKQRPVILNEGCSQISFTYNDVIFQYTDEACSKILRTWKVIDDCVYVPFSNVGVWTYTQVIKVENATAPIFDSGCATGDYTVTQLSSCSARIQATATATDDCTDAEDLEYTYKFDEDNNGSIDFTGTGNVINRVVDFGTHRVLWEVEDECGNVQTCAAIITVDDDKAPTPYCFSEIVTVLMETNGEVTIWANDFDNGSFDNCADADELSISFSPVTTNTSMKFTCDDLDSTYTTIELNIYVTDPAGNQDFCTTSLIVQDNQNFCMNDIGGGPANRVAIGGHIYDDENENVSGVEVVLTADLPEFPLTAQTSDDGGYSFNELFANQTYSIAPASADDYNVGVSTLDLVLIQRHILGLASFDNPYKVIAADINASEKVNAADLLQLRKLILGIYSELPNNDSWRFVDAAIAFEDINDPFPVVDHLDMQDMTQDYMAADFVAVKVGDVNNSASYNLKSSDETNTRSQVMLSVSDRFLEVGINDVKVELSEGGDLFGLQFGIDINDRLVSDIHLASDVLDIAESNYTKTDNSLLASIHSADAVRADGDIMTIIIDVKKAGYLSDMISLSTGEIRDEIYTPSGNSIIAQPVVFEITNRSSDKNTFELMQNVPNPFTTTTDIGFVLPVAQEVTLTIFDVTGKVLTAKTGSYERGYNTIRFDQQDIHASGVLYYQLDTEEYSASKKMIIIK